MKYVLRIGLAGLILSACGGSVDPEAKLLTDCGTVMSRPDAVRFLESLDTNAGEICSCMAAHIATGSEQEQSQSFAAFSKIAAEAAVSDDEIDDIVDGLQEQAENNPDDAALQTINAGIDLTDDYFDSIGDGFSSNGTCPIS